MPAAPGTARDLVGDSGERFPELARDQLPRLLALARHLVGPDAEDAVQECLLKAFLKFSQLQDPAAGPAWLASILVNCCHDLGRARARHPVELDIEYLERFSLFGKISYEDPFPCSDSLHLDFLEDFTPADVREVVVRLPELYRVPLVLVHMEGFLVKEVARMLDVPLGTVLSRLHRGRKLFERQLWEYAAETGLVTGAGP